MIYIAFNAFNERFMSKRLSFRSKKGIYQLSCLCHSLSANNITAKGGKCLAEALKDNNMLRIFW